MTGNFWWMQLASAIKLVSRRWNAECTNQTVSCCLFPISPPYSSSLHTEADWYVQFDMKKKKRTGWLLLLARGFHLMQQMVRTTSFRPHCSQSSVTSTCRQTVLWIIQILMRSNQDFHICVFKEWNISIISTHLSTSLQVCQALLQEVKKEATFKLFFISNN